MILRYLQKVGKHSYKRFIKAIRKVTAHKRFRMILHACLIVAILLVGTFPYSSQVFGQVEMALSTAPVATEEIVLTTKRTSKLPIVGRLSQGFNYYHPGLDIESPMNTPIYPFLEGVIFEAGFHAGGYGNYVLVNHENGYFSLYAHMNTILVAKDERVMQETVLGTVGVTGYSTGSHLHMEIYENGFAVNPLAILPELPNSISAAAKSVIGGASLGRSFILPIAQQPLFIEEETIAEKKSETQKENSPLGIWIPNELKTTNPEKVEVPDDSAVSHQLPTLGHVLPR